MVGDSAESGSIRLVRDSVTYDFDDYVGGPVEELQFWFDRTGIFVHDINERGISGFGQAVVSVAKWNQSNGGYVERRLYLLTPTVAVSSPGVNVDPSGGLVTTEIGGTTTFDVVLNTEPTADVTIGLSSSNTDEGTIDAFSLTFTAADWDQPQTVTITGVDDAIEDGNVAYTISTDAAISTDPNYNGLDADDVAVTNLDNEQAPTVTYDSSQNDVLIPDQGTATSTITVPDLYQVADVNVTLTIDHERVQDLDVYLIGPDGTRVQLFTDVGGNGVNFSGTTLDDEAGTSITAGSAPFGGSFRPEGNLSDFDAKDTDGDWTLEATDDKRSRTGTIRNWSITFETQ
jgi:subtilisin-like proprotein convertase family protein